MSFLALTFLLNFCTVFPVTFIKFQGLVFFLELSAPVFSGMLGSCTQLDEQGTSE